MPRRSANVRLSEWTGSSRPLVKTARLTHVTFKRVDLWAKVLTQGPRRLMPPKNVDFNPPLPSVVHTARNYPIRLTFCLEWRFPMSNDEIATVPPSSFRRCDDNRNTAHSSPRLRGSTQGRRATRPRPVRRASLGHTRHWTAHQASRC
jgi:hypothetical protein